MTDRLDPFVPSSPPAEVTPAAPAAPEPAVAAPGRTPAEFAWIKRSARRRRR